MNRNQYLVSRIALIDEVLLSDAHVPAAEKESFFSKTYDAYKDEPGFSLSIKLELMAAYKTFSLCIKRRDAINRQSVVCDKTDCKSHYMTADLLANVKHTGISKNEVELVKLVKLYSIIILSKSEYWEGLFRAKTNDWLNPLLIKDFLNELCRETKGDFPSCLYKALVVLK